MMDADKLLRDIQALIQSQVDELVEQVIEEAKRSLEVRLRAQTASFAMSLLKFYSVEREGQTIVIRVENKT